MTPNFSLSEFTRSQTASRLGIDNNPPEEVKKRLITLATAVLEPVRAHFGKPVRISSGYRCPALNRAVGSKESSQHLKGEAVDFEIPGVPNIDIAMWVSKHLQYDQCILEFWSPKDPSAGWVHVSYREGNNRNIVLTISQGSTTEGLPEEKD